MPTAIPVTIVEEFPDRSKAEHAVEELARHGFAPEQVEVVLAPGEDVQAFAPARTRVVEGAEAGAAAGVAVGGLVGAALGTAILPGAGTIAGSLLAGAIGGAAAGATGGSILGALIGMSVPEDDAHVYERDFHAGNTIVTVQVAGRYDEALAILQRAQEWSEAKPPHHARRRVAELAEAATSSTDGAGRVFVPQP